MIEQPQLGPIASFTAHQYEWARDVRARIAESLVLHFGEAARLLVIRECNRFGNWYDWTLYAASTRETVQERVLAALAHDGVTQAKETHL